MSKWPNQPQTNAMFGGAFIFMAGGMNMVLGLGWNTNTLIANTQHFQFCWFIGTAVGAILAAPLIPMLPKKIYMILSGLLVLAAGIIFTSVPYNYDAIIAARYINGFATGFATVAFIVHGSEVAAKCHRGYCLAFEQNSITIGMMIQVIYASQWTLEIDFAANRVNGIISIVFGLLAVILAFMAPESPIFYLRKDNEVAAMECLRCLTRPQTVTDATREVLEEDKAYVCESKKCGYTSGLLPLISVLLFRVLLAFSFSLPLSYAIQVGSFVSEGHAYSWPPMVYAVFRLIGGLIAWAFVDGVGRKLHSLFGLLGMGGLIIAVSVIFQDNSNLLVSYDMNVVVTLTMLVQFFAGVYSPSSSVYLGEAFPLLAKPFCIAFCVIAEQVVHIIVICTFTFSSEHLFAYFVAVGVIMLACFLLFLFTVPETKDTSLWEAENRFKHLYFKCY